jgi:hypothetical protein
MRMDVPLLGDAAAQAAYITGIRESIREAFAPSDLLGRFMQHSSGNAVARAYFNLPSSATQTVLPESEDSIVELAAPLGLDLRARADGAIDIAFNGKVLTFAGAARPLLDFFAGKLPASIAQFYQQFADQYERDTLRGFLAEMAKHGVVAIRQPLPGRQKRSNRAGV